MFSGGNILYTLLGGPLDASHHLPRAPTNITYCSPTSSRSTLLVLLECFNQCVRFLFEAVFGQNNNARVKHLYAQGSLGEIELYLC